MDARDKILRLVNEQNDLYHVVSHTTVTMGMPVPVTDSEVAGLEDRNTAVRLTGIRNSGYRGHTDVYYKRHNLNELFVDITPEFRSRDFTRESLLDKVNVRYGLSLELTDLNEYAVPVFTDADLETTHRVELVVRDESYGWIGTVSVDMLYGNPLLTTVVSIQLLPILTHPDSLVELEDRQSGTVATHGFDFTAWQDDLQIDARTGHWATFARVQEIGKLAGLTYWHNGPVVDLPTHAVPEANPAFERVMVQYITGGNVLGPLYFHYDINW